MQDPNTAAAAIPRGGESGKDFSPILETWIRIWEAELGVCYRYQETKEPRMEEVKAK
jgi:hypothetical protein